MAGAGAGTGAGGDVATGELSIQKQLFSAIKTKDLSGFQDLLNHEPRESKESIDIISLTDTWSEASLNQDTLLMRAARNNRLDIVDYLLGLKADPEEKKVLANQAKTGNRVTPLFIAAQNGHLEVVNALLDAGAAVHKPLTDGATPLFIASQKGHLEVVNALIAAGAAVDKPLTDGATPLFIASENGHTEVVKALLDAGAAVDQALTDDGETPLSIAAIQGHMEVVKAFFRHAEEIQFTNPDVFEAFQRDLIRVSKLVTLSPEIRTLCDTEIQKRFQENY